MTHISPRHSKLNTSVRFTGELLALIGATGKFRHDSSEATAESRIGDRTCDNSANGTGSFRNAQTDRSDLAATDRFAMVSALQNRNLIPRVRRPGAPLQHCLVSPFNIDDAQVDRLHTAIAVVIPRHEGYRA